MDSQELTKRFTYHAPKGDQTERYGYIRNGFAALAFMLDDKCPDSRELSLAMTHLEQACMWANAAIARNE
jgi:hypothetical protein